MVTLARSCDQGIATVGIQLLALFPDSSLHACFCSQRMYILTYHLSINQLFVQSINYGHLGPGVRRSDIVNPYGEHEVSDIDFYFPYAPVRIGGVGDKVVT